jgi:hypothetical protein
VRAYTASAIDANCADSSVEKVSSTPASIKRGDESPARAQGRRIMRMSKMNTKKKPEKRDVVMFVIDK